MAMAISKVLVMVLAMVVSLLAIVQVAEGQSSECFTAATSLTNCQPYLAPGNTSEPDSKCCTPLKSLLESPSASCLCNLTSLIGSFGISINISRAPEIAISCNTTVPQSVLSCLATAITPTPSPSPTSSSPPTSRAPSSSSSPSSSPGKSSSAPAPSSSNGKNVDFGFAMGSLMIGGMLLF